MITIGLAESELSGLMDSDAIFQRFFSLKFSVTQRHLKEASAKSSVVFRLSRSNFYFWQGIKI